MRHTQLPYHFYVQVDNRFLGPDMPEGTTAALWHGVYSRPGQLLLAHVMLETGAHWSGLPLHAISSTDKFPHQPESIMPWYSMGEKIEAVYFSYLEGLSCSTIRPLKEDARHTGIIIDWSDGYSRYPQEHKPLNLVELKSGQYSLLPNNFLFFNDQHFVDTSKRTETQGYRRGEEVFWEKSQEKVSIT